jgi:hypothetical protein
MHFSYEILFYKPIIRSYLLMPFPKDYAASPKNINTEMRNSQWYLKSPDQQPG